MNVLLTGAGGQLGNAIRTALDGHTVAPRSHAELDITKLEQVRTVVQGERPELVINAAAYTNVDQAQADIEAAYRVNALGPRNLAIATAAGGIPLLHVSTDHVFDGRAERPYHEFDRVRPLSVYGASKLAGEQAVQQLNPRHYLVRTAWLYHTLGRSFVQTMCGLSDHREVRVVSDQYGSPTYAPHLARAIAQLIPTGAYGTYHLAGSGGTSWFELTRALYDELGASTSIRPVCTAEFPRPAPRPRYAVLTTLQEPRLILPDWRTGLREFASAWKRERHLDHSPPRADP